MDAIIFGDGGLGRAIEAALQARGEPMPLVLGRPIGARHRPVDLRLPAGGRAAGGRAADLAFDAARGPAVVDNVAAALGAGVRRFVIATTGWDTDRLRVGTLLVERGAAAVTAPNLSLGMTLFGRLVERAVELFGPLEAYDPYLVEWHRRTKADRPSGTAKELSRRILAAHPRKTRLADPAAEGPPEPEELDVTAVRAGASPGMHLVGFDAAGESVELRLTARDRSAYAAGALAAADWLLVTTPTAGLHSFDEVVDDLLVAAAGTRPSSGMTA